MAKVSFKINIVNLIDMYSSLKIGSKRHEGLAMIIIFVSLATHYNAFYRNVAVSVTPNQKTNQCSNSLEDHCWSQITLIPIVPIRRKLYFRLNKRIHTSI
jgi:hypothetical protein